VPTRRAATGAVGARRALAAALVAAPLAALATVAPAAAPGSDIPLLDDLGSFHRPITTRSPAAQRYFDQGMRLLFAFALEEAERSFAAAMRLDPACAGCAWGMAMSLGPHINVAGVPERTAAAARAARQALALAPRASPVEQALAAAVARRSADPPPRDAAGQAALDRAYAAAMREVRRRFPDDMDVAALLAEALMDLHPWDYWAPDGSPRPWTPEILQLLEEVLRRQPDHPGANHYYIHAVEASPHPERAVAAAERLSHLMPGAAHLVHMPSHILARVGRYAEASEVNRRAIAADRAFEDRVHPRGFYQMYAAHNHQFLWSTALMQGRAAEALQQARTAAAMLPPAMLRRAPGFDGVQACPIWTLVRFRRMTEALREPAPPADLVYADASWHAARGVALAVSGDAAAAEREAAAVAAAVRGLPAGAPQGFNTAQGLLGIAQHFLEGEVAAVRGRREAAVAALRAAVAGEDALRYAEPADWFFPLRPQLAAVLLAAGREREAAAVCEEDLRRHPENGWALAALAESLRRRHDAAGAGAVGARLARAWSQADLQNPEAMAGWIAPPPPRR
jgi:tetratricopeptide (TPR) repeat protein